MYIGFSFLPHCSREDGTYQSTFSITLVPMVSVPLDPYSTLPWWEGRNSAGVTGE